MPKRVDVGNGYIAEFPDEMSNDDISAALRKQFGGPEPAENKPSNLRIPTLGERVSAGTKAGGRSLFSAVTGVGQAALGAGDYAGAVGQMVRSNVRGLTGQPDTPEDPAGFLSPTDAFQRAQANRQDVQKEYPTNALAGTVLGGIATAPRVAAALPNLIPKAGQTLGNIGRVMLAGEAAGGVQGALESPDAPIQGAASGAAIGGVAGPVGAAVAKGVGYAATPAVISAAKALSKIVQEPPEVIARAITNLKAATGRPVQAQDILDLKQAGRLRELAGANPDLAASTIKANEASASARANAYANKTAQGGTGSPAAREEALRTAARQGQTGSPAAREAALTTEAAARPRQSPVELQTALERQADADFGAVREANLALGPEDTSFILDDVLPMVPFTRAARARIHADVVAGRLNGGDFDAMRRKLGNIARAKPGEGAYELREELLNRGREALPELETAVTNYRTGSERIAGAELGQRVLTEKDTAGFLESTRRLSDAGREGLVASTRNLLTNMAQGSPTAGDQLARQLAENPGFRTRIQAVLGPEETQALLRPANAISGAGVGERVLSEGDTQAFNEAFRGLPAEGQSAARETTRNTLRNLSDKGQLAGPAAENAGFIARLRTSLGPEAEPTLRAAHNIYGAKLGDRILTETDTKTFVDDFRRLSAEGQDHARQAARAAFTDAARKGPDAAETLVQNVAANPGLEGRMRAVLGEKQANDLLRSARAEAASIASSNRATVLPRDRKGAGLVARGAQAAAGVAAAARGSIPAAGYHLSEAAKPAGQKLSKKVEAILSKWVEDPKETRRAIASMRLIGIHENKIRVIMQRAAVAGGILGTSALGQGSAQ